MKNQLLIFAFLLGINSILSQAILIRELTISLYGNEFFLGLVFASWFFWIAVGSKFFYKFFIFIKNIYFLIISFFLFNFLLFLEFFLIKYLAKPSNFPGEIPNLFFSSLLIFFSLAPLCVFLGSLWTNGTKIFCQKIKENFSQVLNNAYYFEILGFIFGGISFSFLLVKLEEVLVLKIFFIINFFLLLFWCFLENKNFSRKYGSVFFLFFILFLVFSFFSQNINQTLENLRFKNQKILEIKNTYYGRIFITQTENQYNFFENNIFLGSTNDWQFAEEFVHLSLIHHPLPKKVFLIGGGQSGIIEEIFKHPTEKIYYSEIDPALIEMVKNYSYLNSKKIFSDHKLKILNEDPRYFLKKSQEKFDFILINLSAPSTALINRFYTKNFFELVKERLKDEGILTIQLPFSESSPNQNLKNLNTSLFKTLKKTFPEIKVISGEFNLFLASNEKINSELEALLKVFKERKIETRWLNENYIKYRLTTERNEKTKIFLEENQNVKINQDFLPISYFYQTLFWLDHFCLRFSQYLKIFSFHFFYFLFFFLLFLFFLTKRLKTISFPLFSVFVAGFSIMSLEILLVFVYQTLVGHLYFRITLLITLLMAGMATGVWFGKKIKESFSNLIKFHLFSVLFCFFLLAFFYLFSTKSFVLIEFSLFLLIFFAGFLGSIFFPISNKIYLSLQKEPIKKTGSVYAADLAGSCLGSFFTPIVVLPVYGVFAVLLFLAFLNLLLVILFTLLQKPGQ